MADTTISPNMGLIVPTVGVDPGPDWANNINASLSVIDGHNHSPGSGNQINSDGIAITSNLSMNQASLLNVGSVNYYNLVSPLDPSATDTMFVSGGDLYYNDGAGNQIQITYNGSVTGTPGSITGLVPPASASYNSGVFSFESAPGIPSTISGGSIRIGTQVSPSKSVTFAASITQSSDYTLTLPYDPPSANQILETDASGNLAWGFGQIPIGAVIATFPSLTGAYACNATIAADDRGFVLCQGQTIADPTSPMNGQVVPNLSNDVFIKGSTTDGDIGGVAYVSLTEANLAAHTHGPGNYQTSLGITGSAPSLNNNTVASDQHHHQYKILYSSYYGGLGSTGGGFGNPDPWLVLAWNGVTNQYLPANLYAQSVSELVNNGLQSGSNQQSIDIFESQGYTDWPDASKTVGISGGTWSLTGSNLVAGSSTSTGSGTPFDTVPPYVSAVYVMRIK